MGVEGVRVDFVVLEGFVMECGSKLCFLVVANKSEGSVATGAATCLGMG